MSRKTRDKILIALGILLILIAATIYASYEYRDRKAGEYSQELLNDFFEDKASDIKHDSAKGEMPQATYRGYPVIGIIKVPKVNIQLPVLSEWSYDLLNISPCRYSGNIEERDLIILGHNYNSHFTPLKNCIVGDTVEFLDVNNVTYKYRIDKIEQLYKIELDRLTSSDYDLTIFTCTYGGQNRYVARCTMVSD